MSSNETGYTFCVCFFVNSFYDDGIKKPIFMNIQRGGYEVLCFIWLQNNRFIVLQHNECDQKNKEWKDV